MNYLKLLINKPLKNYKSGYILSLKSANDGLPEDLYWRARIKDAEIDDCVSILKNEKSIDHEEIKINYTKKQKKLGDKNGY